MVLAEVGLSDLILTTIWVFFLVMFIWVFIAAVNDLLRDHEVSGAATAAWVVALIAFPLVGPIAYLTVRGKGMAERFAARHPAAQSPLDSSLRQTAASSGSEPVDNLARLAELRNIGVVTDAEFDTIKARIMADTPAAS